MTATDKVDHKDSHDRIDAKSSSLDDHHHLHPTMTEMKDLGKAVIGTLSDASAAALHHTVDKTFGAADAVLCSTGATSGHKGMSATEAATMVAAGAMLMNHQSPETQRAAVEAGHNEAARIGGMTNVNEGDIQAAVGVYAQISGLGPSAMSARGTLDSAINNARGKLDAARAAGQNGSGDNAAWVQANFGSAEAYLNWKKAHQPDKKEV